MNFKNFLLIRHASLIRGMGVAWFVLFVSLLITVWLWHLTKADDERFARERFEHQVSQMIRFDIRERMLVYEQMLNSFVSFIYHSSELVTREEWRTYYENLKMEKRYPSIQGIGFARYILPAEKDALIQQIRAQGFPDFMVWPAGERSEYTPIIYIVPFDWRNRETFGYDMFSEPVRRAAMKQARDTGVTTVSGKITLVQETNQDMQAGFLVYLPVYQKNRPLETVEQRRAALLGYVYSPFRMNDLMQGILGRIAPDDIHLKIFDGKEISESTQLYDSDPLTPAPKEGPFTLKTELDVGGHSWTLLASVKPGSTAVYKVLSPLMVLLTGVLVSLLLFFIIWSLVTTRQHAQSLKRISQVDGLTGIANRRYFDEYLNKEWRRALRSAQMLALIMMDVDHFKAYNDGYGHQAGDDCLRKMARALSAEVRRPADLLARYGGEEVVAVLPDTSLAGALLIAENIRLAVEAIAIPHAKSPTAPHVTLSLGVAAVVPTPATLPKLLIEAADKALYQAKAEGRNRICAGALPASTVSGIDLPPISFS